MQFPLLLRCGLLQRLCSDSAAEAVPVALHDIPGGGEAFELCAKFAYGITINLSARNFVPAICAAKFLRMTESVAGGNLVAKLEAFFDTCVLRGWKDSVAALRATRKLPGWADNLGLVQRCVGAVVDKILTPPARVSWSYTYTRPGYSGKHHRSVPRDWWTEDVSDLDLEDFRTVVSAVRAAKDTPPPLIGEALHVYACKNLPDPSTAATEIDAGQGLGAVAEDALIRQRRVLESIVSMVPTEQGSVSAGFLMRLLRIAAAIGASPSARAELVRRSGRQLHEAGARDLLFRSPSGPRAYDMDLVKAVLENFLAQFRRPAPPEETEKAASCVRKVAAAIDAYLQVVARCADTPVGRFADLAAALPEVARPRHDELYRAIDTYLKEHPELSKEEKKQLCRTIDCRKLSPEARSHAVRNDRLPLRTIMQLLFAEQERAEEAVGQESPRRLAAAAAAAGNKSPDAHDGRQPDYTATKSGEQQGRVERPSAMGKAKSAVIRMAAGSRSAAGRRTGRKEADIGEDDGLGSRYRVS